VYNFGEYWVFQLASLPLNLEEGFVKAKFFLVSNFIGNYAHAFWTGWLRSGFTLKLTLPINRPLTANRKS
jgi:hypothetical protein